MVQWDAGVLKLRGPIRMETADALYHAGVPFCDGRAIRLDLSEVEDVDSSALALLLAWQRLNTGAGGAAIGFEQVPADLKVLADLYDLGEMFSAHGT